MSNLIEIIDRSFPFNFIYRATIKKTTTFHIYRDCFRELNEEKTLRRFNRKIIEFT